MLLSVMLVAAGALMVLTSIGIPDAGLLLFILGVAVAAPGFIRLVRSARSKPVVVPGEHHDAPRFITDPRRPDRFLDSAWTDEFIASDVQTHRVAAVLVGVPGGAAFCWVAFAVLCDLRATFPIQTLLAVLVAFLVPLGILMRKSRMMSDG